MSATLGALVGDFARGIQLADARRPQAVNVRTRKPFQPGIGPHSEAMTVELVLGALAEASPAAYVSAYATGVPYPEQPRQKCDLCLGQSAQWDWAIEIKMLRMLGDNGKPNDNMLMHVLSPYPAHRSALTDCDKLVHSDIAPRKAVVIYGYETDQWPLDAAVHAFEALARARVHLGPRCGAAFDGLVHPIHCSGTVFGWEILA